MIRRMTHAGIIPITIDPKAWYAGGDTRLLLDMTESAMARARRSGELRFARRGQRVWYRGQWIIEWLERAAQEVDHAAH